jgi:hypothetical protein
MPKSVPPFHCVTATADHLMFPGDAADVIDRLKSALTPGSIVTELPSRSYSQAVVLFRDFGSR